MGTTIPCIARAMSGRGGRETGIATVRRIEAAVDEITGTAQTVSKIQRALETAGIIFIDQDERYGPGVRLRKPPP
jgi:hypothetical protein